MKAPVNMPYLVLCLQTFATDVQDGFVEITRHSLALFGLDVVLISLAFFGSARSPGLGQRCLARLARN